MISVLIEVPLAVNEAIKEIASVQYRSAKKQYRLILENVPEVKAMVAQMQGEQA